MSDTTDGMQDRYEDLLLKRSPEERLRMGASMFTMAQKLVRASILGKTPTLAENEVRARVFLRFYGEDLDQDFCAAILRALRAN